MKKKKQRVSQKKLKNLRNMLFVKRVVDDDGIHDHFFHEIGQITLVRSMWRASWGTYVNWSCPELGGGNCGIGYWLSQAKQQTNRHDSQKCHPNRCPR